MDMMLMNMFVRLTTMAAEGELVVPRRPHKNSMFEQSSNLKPVMLKLAILGGYTNVKELRRLTKGVPKQRLQNVFGDVMAFSHEMPLVKLLQKLLPAEDVDAVLRAQHIAPLLWFCCG